jgi:CBS domain-containing protein
MRFLDKTGMKVGEVMTRGVEPISPDVSVRDAAICMAELDVGALLVGLTGAVEGILTDRDILLRVVVDGLDPSGVQVREVMSSSLFVCREDDEAETAVQRMAGHQIRRMPVVDDAGVLVGIVTLGDLTGAGRHSRPASETPRRLSGSEAQRRSARPR